MDTGEVRAKEDTLGRVRGDSGLDVQEPSRRASRSYKDLKGFIPEHGPLETTAHLYLNATKIGLCR